MPPVLLTAIPADLEELGARDSEHLFIAILLPSIVLANAEIAADRERLLAITAGVPADAEDWASRLSPKDARWVHALSVHYEADLRTGLADLRARVDTIPTSLALAQAIDESGWGRSRRAAFESVYHAAAAHLHDLNTTSAYTELRSRRASLRDQGHRPGGLALAPALAASSEGGPAYVDGLVAIMRRHHLEDFDTVALDPERQLLRVFVERRRPADVE